MTERTRSPSQPEAVGRRRGRLATSLLTVSVALLGGCSSPSATPSPLTTVTVWAGDGTASGGSPSPDAAPSSVPTVTAPPLSSPPASETPSTTPPTTTASTTTASRVAVGKLRGAPRDYAEAQQRVSAAPVASGVGGTFVSPSGNIFCAYTDELSSLECEVADGRAPAPASAPCPGGGGAPDIGRIELTAGGATPICNSDTIRRPGAAKLAYGKRATVPGTPFSCLSERSGMTCTDTDGHHGFFLARATYATF